jgi:xanthine dehydrogenase large subunit
MKHDSISSGQSLAIAPIGAAHQELIHDSAIKHVTGRAEYTDDLTEPSGTLHAALGLSTVAHGRIVSMDLDPVRAAPGVVDVLTAADVPGPNDISPTGKRDDPIFATREVLFHGQPIFAVVAKSRDQARRAARLARIEYEALPHHLDPLAARAGGMDYVTEPLTLRRGEP